MFMMWGILLLSCDSSHNRTVSFEEIDYSYDNGWDDAFSLRVNKNGKCIIAKGRWENKKYFINDIGEKDLQRIDSVYRNVLTCNLDTIYSRSVEDGEAYKIVSGLKSFYVYGGGEPVCLKELGNILHMLTEAKLIPFDTVIAFKSLNSFYPPEIKIDSSSFLPRGM